MSPEVMQMAHNTGKHCFTYCGDERCDCPAREAFGLLGRVSTALPVLSTMLHKIGAHGGARLATEMHDEATALRFDHLKSPEHDGGACG